MPSLQTAIDVNTFIIGSLTRFMASKKIYITEPAKGPALTSISSPPKAHRKITFANDWTYADGLKRKRKANSK